MPNRWRAPLVVGALGLALTPVVVWIVTHPSSETTLVGTIVGILGIGATAIGVAITARLSSHKEELFAEVDRRTRDLQTVIQHAPDATLLVDSDGTIRSASDRTESLLGWPPGELLGKSVELLIPEPLRGVHRQHRMNYVRDNPSAREMGPDRELLARHRDGSEIPVDISLSPMPPDRNGHVGQVAVALRDATIRRDAERNLREAVSQKNAFIRTVSHELRTPLTAIGGFTDLLETSWDSFNDATKREFLRRIGRNAMGLHALIEEVLAFSRLERNQLTVDPHPLDLGKTIAHAVDQLATVLERQPVEIVVPAHSVMVSADEHAVVRIVTNLLVNASRYAPDGSTITVTVTDNDPADLLVDDQGPGIPDSERNLVFEQFWRGSHSHVIEQPGTGIGLAVVRQLAELMGGTASAEDSPTGGARLRVTLPRTSQPAG